MEGFVLITILTAIISIFFTVPLLGFMLVLFLSKLITKNVRKSVHTALDYTTILFIISVHFLIVTILGKSFFWLIILIIILSAMLFSVIHWKVKGEIVFKKVLKAVWRFNFLFFFTAYIGLTVFGLIERAVTFTFAT
jgi:hypothetical protein